MVALELVGWGEAVEENCACDVEVLGMAFFEGDAVEGVDGEAVAEQPGEVNVGGYVR